MPKSAPPAVPVPDIVACVMVLKSLSIITQAVMHHTNYNDCPSVVFTPHKYVFTFDCHCGLRRFWLFRKVYDFVMPRSNNEMYLMLAVFIGMPCLYVWGILRLFGIL